MNHCWPEAKATWSLAELEDLKIFLQAEVSAGRYKPLLPSGLD